MRFFHLGDLHIGKQLHGLSLLDDQKAILRQIVEQVPLYRPDAVLIAGDIYDRSVPAGEAVNLFDIFLTDLAGLGVPVCVVSGNHDSPERLNFGSRLMKTTGIHLCGVFRGRPERVELADAEGPVHIHLLPFVKPGMVRPFFPDAGIETYEDAVRAAIGAAPPDPAVRNILVAHQFVTSGGRQPERSESESFSVGGIDNVDASLFDGFDYVALGHIHGPQAIGRPAVRYAGSPLKYSFSEANHRKGITLVDLDGARRLEVTLIPLEPVLDLRELRGPLAALLAAAQEAEIAAGAPCRDYIRAILTDADDLMDPFGQLRLVYPNLMAIGREHSRAPDALAADAEIAVSDLALRSPLTLFGDFYRFQNGSELTDAQVRILSGIFESAGGLP